MQRAEKYVVQAVADGIIEQMGQLLQRRAGGCLIKGRFRPLRAEPGSIGQADRVT